MKRTLAASLLLVVTALASPARASEGDFLGPAYPLDVDVSYTAGLFQWVDSLANTSIGKTIPAHKREFVRRWGRPTAQDNELLLEFRHARFAHAAATHDPSTLLGIFCAAPSVDAAIAAARKNLTDDETADLRAALSGLAPKFDEIWDGGAVPRAFVERVAKDPQRAELAAFLAKVAAFFGVDPNALPRPRLVLVPVPDGWGTHAQAVGRLLLLEIRPGDGLAQEAAVIVHENAHFLLEAIPEARRAALAAEAKSLHGSGETAWKTLQEALPTTLGQGMADRMFRPIEWSRRDPWYHTPEVDGYAKALHATVNHVLARGGRFDEDFVLQAVQVWVDGGKRHGPEILGMDAGGKAEKAAPTPR